WETATIAGITYTPHIYGRREAQLTKYNASLHGIALDDELALHESPLRVLEPGEIPGAVAAESCPVSGAPVAALMEGAAVNLTSLDVVEFNGHLHEMCGGILMPEQLEAALDEAEAGSDPRVRVLGAGSSS